MHQLTKENFEEEVLKAKGEVLVKFAAKTGCQPCATFKPQYEAVSKSGLDTDKKFCVYERETLRMPSDEIETRYKITSFPTVLLFKDGELVGQVAKYKFYNNRELATLILDEQKKLLNQQFYVEDLIKEDQLRKQPMSQPKAQDYIYDITPVPKPAPDLSGFPEGQSPEEGGCEGCGSEKQ